MIDDDMFDDTPKEPESDGFWAIIIWTIVALIAVFLLAAYAPLGI